MFTNFDRIIAGFTKTVNKLEQRASYLADQEAAKTAKIKTLKDECIACETEAAKCMAVADKLNKLLEV